MYARYYGATHTVHRFGRIIVRRADVPEEGSHPHNDINDNRRLVATPFSGPPPPFYRYGDNKSTSKRKKKQTANHHFTDKANQTRNAADHYIWRYVGPRV